MRRRAIVWLPALLLVIMLMGLDASGAAPAPPPDARPGGKLVVGFQYEPVTLDPHVSGQANASRAILKGIPAGRTAAERRDRQRQDSTLASQNGRPLQ